MLEMTQTPAQRHFERTQLIVIAGGAVVRNSPANASDPRDSGSILELGRSPGVGNGNPFQYSCLDNSMDREAWQGYSPWDCKELAMTDHTHTQVILKEGARVGGLVAMLSGFPKPWMWKSTTPGESSQTKWWEMIITRVLFMWLKVGVKRNSMWFHCIMPLMCLGSPCFTFVSKGILAINFHSKITWQGHL